MGIYDGNTGGGECPANPTCPVKSGLMKLDDELGVLENKLVTLASKLEYAMLPSLPRNNDKEQKAEQTPSPLRLEIEHTIQRVIKFVDFVQDINARLEVW